MSFVLFRPPVIKSKPLKPRGKYVKQPNSFDEKEFDDSIRNLCLLMSTKPNPLEESK